MLHRVFPANDTVTMGFAVVSDVDVSKIFLAAVSAMDIIAMGFVIILV